MPPPFTSFEATGFPSEILREVSAYCLSFVTIVVLLSLCNNDGQEGSPVSLMKLCSLSVSCKIL